MKIKKRKIVCYNCKKTKGVAYWELSEKRYKKYTLAQREQYGWRAKGFKHMAGTKIVKNEWLCDKCDTTRRCMKCGILLSNLWKCNCGNVHTAYYEEHPNHCKKCWDKIENKINHGAGV